ncbi:hypothetical protein IWQ47_002507 [Aquimarina sp. EL_43]|nr:hypothetical protein [Aquimarina sp. EL_35]MBG6151496.1 hypothetical protein [Aquimarina sp. EL_32]MBG6169427.1 hypothetical protein [Aquimarina sp. EL_43]
MNLSIGFDIIIKARKPLVKPMLKQDRALYLSN